MFYVLNIVLLFHFSLPSDKLRRIFETHGHLCHPLGRFCLLLINEVLLSLQGSGRYFHVSLMLGEIGRGSGLDPSEVQLSLSGLLNCFFDLVWVAGTGSLGR